MKLLLAHDRVDPNSEDQSGRTPLSWAAERGWNETIAQLLVEPWRINLDSKDKKWSDTTIMGFWEGEYANGEAATRRGACQFRLSRLN